MKIKIEVEIDTNEDRDEIDGLIESIMLIKQQLAKLKDEEHDDN